MWKTSLGFLGLIFADVVLGQQCQVPKTALLLSDDDKTKTLYRIGILSIRGVEAGIKEFNETATYLTKAAGARFDPPIRFEIVPVVPGEAFDVFQPGNVDFVFANPSIFSCIDSEIGASSLATIISKRKVDGSTYRLTEFGGVIFTKANNTEIKTVADIRGKSVAAVSITGLGSGQMQFRVLQQAGIHHMQDPKQVIFMKSQGKVVNGVLGGQVDVGFVRTDQLERSTDSRTGELVDLAEIKIIGPLDATLSDGSAFPFTPSTTLYPEWNMASFPLRVSDAIAQEVQSSLLEQENHASAAPMLLECMEMRCNPALVNKTTEECLDECFASLDPTTLKNCDTTPDLALAAFSAMNNGKYAGWRSSMSYMPLRNMQEEIGFIALDEETGAVKCHRATELADAIVCPQGHFKRRDEEIMKSCEQAGLDCFGFQCICSPCVEAFDVDFLPLDDKTARSGCAKFEICGSVQQAHTITYRAVDNKKRKNATLTVNVIRDGVDQGDLRIGQVTATQNEFEFEFVFEDTLVPAGVAILEVFVNGDQISQSPFRVDIVPRDCAADNGDPLTEPDSAGTCACKAGTIKVGKNCVRTFILLLSIFIPIAAIVAFFVFRYIREKKRQADVIWKIDVKDITFPEPPVILGRGSFGLVILGTFRGTSVAVKRALAAEDNTAVELQASARRSQSKLDTSAEFDFQQDEDDEEAPAKRRQHLRSNMRRSHSKCDISAEFDFKDKDEAPLNRRQQLSSWGTRSTESSNRNLGSRSRNLGTCSRDAVLGSSCSVAEKSTQHLRREFMKEMRLLSKLRHPNITTVMGAVVSGVPEPLLVLEYMELNSLYDILHNESMILEGETLLPILRDISSGLRFLHSASPQIIHGDVKASNILVDSRFRAKVNDFGFASKKGASGTPFWMAPELLLGDSSNSTASDVYAFGILLFEVTSRKEPYEEEADLDLILKEVADPIINRRPPIPSACPKEVAGIMADCFGGDPEMRPSMEEIEQRLKRLDGENIPSCRHSNSVRNEDLLLKVFPKHVAEALRDGRQIEPDKKDCVTCYFSDIVGFTTISATLSAEKVTDMLDRLYLRFDKLSLKHDVFKMETIGDAYLAVTNLVKDQEEDHVKRMAEFAIDAMEAASEVLVDEDDPSLGFVKIRSGFHIGPAIARVVGSSNPKYSIYGDTVNVASRMESNSKTGRIQCSEPAALKLKDNCPGLVVSCRGPIPIKGKGHMVTYWVGRKKKKPSLLPKETAPMIENLEDV